MCVQTHIYCSRHSSSDMVAFCVVCNIRVLILPICVQYVAVLLRDYQTEYSKNPYEGPQRLSTCTLKFFRFLMNKIRTFDLDWFSKETESFLSKEEDHFSMHTMQLAEQSFNCKLLLKIIYSYDCYENLFSLGS